MRVTTHRTFFRVPLIVSPLPIRIQDDWGTAESQLCEQVARDQDWRGHPPHDAFTSRVGAAFETLQLGPRLREWVMDDRWLFSLMQRTPSQASRLSWTLEFSKVGGIFDGKKKLSSFLEGDQEDENGEVDGDGTMSKAKAFEAHFQRTSKVDDALPTS